MAELNKLKYVHPTSNEKTLDQTLDELESLIGRLDAKNTKAATEILNLLDELHIRFKGHIKFDKEGVPENSQLAYLYKQIHKQAPQLSKAVGGDLFFQAKRKKTFVPAQAWWWHLDQYLAQKRKNTLIKTIRGLVIFLVITAAVVLIYQRWFAPPPEVRARLGFENQASVAIEDGRYADALTAVNQAITFGPEQYSLWVQKGMLLLRLEEETAAQESFAQALTLGIDEERYYIERAYNAMQIGMEDQAMEDVEQVLRVNPQSPEGYLFKAQILEGRGDSYAALRAYEEASRLAESQDKIELMTTIRMRMGMLMQSVQLPTVSN